MITVAALADQQPQAQPPQPQQAPTPPAAPEPPQTTPSTATQPIVIPPPAASSGPETYDPDRAWSLEPFYWETFGHPTLKGGQAAPDYENLSYPGKSKRAPGGVLSIPVSKTDIIRVSYFQVQGDGNTTATEALDLFATPLSAGDFLAVQYKLRVAKASFEDLLYPFPGHGAKVRYKTLWEVQYASISSSIDAPLASPTVDSSGNVTYPTATGTRQVILPTFGMAVEYAPSRRIYCEVRASGFGIPHHADLVDTEASAAYRIGPVQIVVGGKFYHFKTSPQNAEYLSSNIDGGYIGLRYMSK